MPAVLQKIIDISPVITENTGVWPGDTPLTRQVLCDIRKDSHLDLSTLHSTVHIGAHADAPRHYHVDGKTMEQVSLEPYLGRCWVVSVVGKRQIERQDCESAVGAGAKRILFRTLSQPDPQIFSEVFTSISAEAMEYMGKAGVVLVGLDTPSVDPFNSKDLPAHKMLHRYSIVNLEGLVLQHVDDGIYELIALPLRLHGFDASPVRAILRTI